MNLGEGIVNAKKEESKVKILIRNQWYRTDPLIRIRTDTIRMYIISGQYDFLSLFPKLLVLYLYRHRMKTTDNCDTQLRVSCEL